MINRLMVATVCVLLGVAAAAGQEPRPRAVLMHGELPVDCLAFSRDGSTLASYSLGNGELKLWNVAGRTVAARRSDVELALKREPGQRTIPTSARNYSTSFGQLILSPNGKLVAWNPNFFEKGEGVKLWSPPKAEIADVAVPKRFEPQCQAFSPDAKLLALGCDKKAVVLWDVDQSKVAGVLRHGRPEDSTVEAIAYSPDGKTIAAARSGYKIDLWDVVTGEITKRLMAHVADDKDDDAKVAIVAFSPDGQTLASVAEGTIKVWDLAVGKSFATIDRAAEGSIFSVAFAADSKTLVFDMGRESVALWDSHTNKPIATLKNRHGISALTADGKVLATGGENGVIQLWDMPTGRTSK